MKPKLIILSGLPFSGKSTIAKKLGDSLGIKVVSYDHDIYAKHKDEVPPGTSPAKEYEIIQAIAREYLRSLLTEDESIIYDDLNLEKTDRQLLLELAGQCNAKAHIIFVDTPLPIIEERRQANMKLPNRDHIGEEKMQLNISLLQKPSKDENAIYFKPGDSVEELLRMVR
ncbi:MAG TPA: ATP-binding protein [Candidatus Saccharimonadales bacterium]|nr:ATP-binding protein [Candidatus Saccharimonadales bacterium]